MKTHCSRVRWLLLALSVWRLPVAAAAEVPLPSQVPAAVVNSSPGAVSPQRRGGSGKVAVVLGNPVPSHVAPVSATSKQALANALTGVAFEAYAAAKVLYNDADYRGALTKLRVAYSASGDPRLLWNMAACHKQLRQYAAVEALLNVYLAAGDAWLTVEDKQQADELLRVISGFVSTTSLRVVPVGAEVWLDDQKVDWSELIHPLRLDMGQHVVRAVMSGFVPKETRFEVVGGSELELKLALDPIAQAGLALVAASSGNVSVDGVEQGRQFSGLLTVGRHDIRIDAAGFASIQRRLLVGDQQQSLIAVKFESDRSAPVPTRVAPGGAVPHWVWLVGGTLLATVASGVVIAEVAR